MYNMNYSLVCYWKFYIFVEWLPDDYNFVNVGFINMKFMENHE